ncbi:MAG: DUF2117 domain-containing protein [Archaeoglobales archaeon]|nr:DUF2117 domain-containing protein [Archaeoglobales archaeon]
MKICLLVHGAEAFYSGAISELLERLKHFGETEIFVTGTMAKTASLDVDFNVKVWNGTPSELLKALEREFDLFLLLSYSKSPKSGYAFGEIVFKRSGVKKPFLQLELCNKTAVAWNCEAKIAESFGFRIFQPMSFDNVWRENERTYRRILAVEPGEFLLVGGIVVGKVRDNEVLLVAENREIVELRGVEIKEHGLEKLRRIYQGIDLEKIKICSLKGFKTKEAEFKGKRGTGVAFIDHSGDMVYRFAGNCEGAVCIGDDTTAISSEILFRFGTPVLGIVDGDRDFISQVKNIHSDSEIFVTKHDDLAGKIIFEEVFCEKEILEENFTSLKDKIAKILQSKDLLLSRKAMEDFI